MTGLKGEDYRGGALERLDDARILLQSTQFAGAVASAGRAVEGMLRAVIWKRDDAVRMGQKPLETGHDLRELLAAVSDLGLISSEPNHADQLRESVQRVARLWFNNMRFASSRFVETRWYNLGEVRRGRTMKQASERFYLACLSIVKECEALCQKQDYSVY